MYDFLLFWFLFWMENRFCVPLHKQPLLHSLDHHFSHPFFFVFFGVGAVCCCCFFHFNFKFFLRPSAVCMPFLHRTPIDDQQRVALRLPLQQIRQDQTRLKPKRWNGARGPRHRRWLFVPFSPWCGLWFFFSFFPLSLFCFRDLLRHFKLSEFLSLDGNWFVQRERLSLAHEALKLSTKVLLLFLFFSSKWLKLKARCLEIVFVFFYMGNNLKSYFSWFNHSRNKKFASKFSLSLRLFSFFFLAFIVITLFVGTMHSLLMTTSIYHRFFSFFFFFTALHT